MNEYVCDVSIDEHYCHAWDGLLISKNDAEYKFCTCMTANEWEEEQHKRLKEIEVEVLTLKAESNRIHRLIQLSRDVV